MNEPTTRDATMPETSEQREQREEREREQREMERSLDGSTQNRYGPPPFAQDWPSPISYPARERERYDYGTAALPSMPPKDDGPNLALRDGPADPNLDHVRIVYSASHATKLGDVIPGHAGKAFAVVGPFDGLNDRGDLQEALAEVLTSYNERRARP